jgi:perosamine synthetase
LRFLTALPLCPGDSVWHHPGDKIIILSYPVATANAIRYTGATPVFADITSADDLNISPEIEAKIDGATKA